MDLADTMVSSKTQWNRMSDGTAAICLLLAESSSVLCATLKGLRETKELLQYKLKYQMEMVLQ